MYIYIYIYLFINCRSLRSKPQPWPRKSHLDTRIPALKIKALLESSPAKFKNLVGRLAGGGNINTINMHMYIMYIHIMLCCSELPCLI